MSAPDITSPYASHDTDDDDQPVPVGTLGIPADYRPEGEAYVTVRTPDSERTIFFPDGSTLEFSGEFAADPVGKTRGVRPKPPPPAARPDAPPSQAALVEHFALHEGAARWERRTRAAALLHGAEEMQSEGVIETQRALLVAACQHAALEMFRRVQAPHIEDGEAARAAGTMAGLARVADGLYASYKADIQSHLRISHWQPKDAYRPKPDETG